jgi:hypothetical protein
VNIGSAKKTTRWIENAMPADGTKAAHLANGNLGTSRLEQLLKTIQHVLVCKEGDSSSHFRKWRIASLRGDAAIQSLSEQSGHSARRVYSTGFMSTRPN